MPKEYEDVAVIQHPRCRYTEEEIKEFYRSGRWGDDHLSTYLDRDAERFPNKLAVFDTQKRITYAELQEQAYSFSAALLSLGVEKGDRVAVQLSGRVEYSVAYVGIVRIGAVMVPVNPVYREHELEQIFNNVTPKVFIESVKKFV